MTASYFIGERLTVPNLRFNASSPAASHPNARQGLRMYGPYDSQRLGKGKISAALIYPNSLKTVSQIVRQGLIQGNGAFRGFQNVFRIPIEFIAERCATNETENDFRRELQSVLNERPDIVVFLTSTRNQNLYSATKAETLGNGIPSQLITAEKLQIQDQIQWALENIALQIYAKIGGTPWTVMSSSPRNELVLGVSRALDRQRNFVVGFVTLFTYDGDYQFLYSLSPKPTEWSKLDEYRDALAGLIVKAHGEYAQEQGQPTSLVIHLCKRPGRYREVAAVEQAIQKIGNSIAWALLHLNDDSNYRLFDTAHRTYIPESGIKVTLSPKSALLLLDGRPLDAQAGIRRKRGVPRVLEVTMDHRSTMAGEQFPRLVQQMFEFSRVNWRGFNAQAIPATLNYSYLVARLVAEIGAERWNAIASSGMLRDKAWFL
jgi:hypothetical protein